MTEAKRLTELVRGLHPLVSICTDEEAEAVAFVRQVCNDLNFPLRIWSCANGLHDGFIKPDPQQKTDTEHPAAALFSLLKTNERQVVVMLDVAGHLGDNRTLRQLRETVAHFERTNSTLLLIDCTDNLPPAVKAHAVAFEMPLPSGDALYEAVRDALKSRNRIESVQIDITRQELDAIVRNLAGLTLRQARQVIFDAVADDNRLCGEDLARILASKRKYLQADGVLEFVEAPVSMDQIGGLAALKAWLKKREGALDPKAVDFGIKPPRGVLLLGVQGAGKSLSAKAVATAWQRPLLRLDPGTLYDRYIGESEKRLRAALAQAERMAPVVLWVDEIEKGFASAASTSTDGGLSRRMFGSLLTWMNDHKSPVFFVATANDIDALPPELLRKGRFDEIFFVDLPGDEARQAIFEIHLRKRKREPAKFDLAALVAASDGFSGSEIEQAIASALFDAYSAKIELSTACILRTLRESPPLSVTAAEKIAELRAWAKDRCVPAD